MKAYMLSSDYAEFSKVIYAETRNQAKSLALYSDGFEDIPYIDIVARRLPKADALYRGSYEGDWQDMKLRKILVEDYGWYCIEPDILECKECRLCDDWSDRD